MADVPCGDGGYGGVLEYDSEKSEELVLVYEDVTRSQDGDGVKQDEGSAGQIEEEQKRPQPRREPHPAVVIYRVRPGEERSETVDRESNIPEESKSNHVSSRCDAILTDKSVHLYVHHYHNDDSFIGIHNNWAY